MTTIIVSATALAKSGALTILNEFIEYVSNLKKYKFIIFIPDSVNLPKTVNIRYIPVPKKNWLSRIYWDSCGLRKYIRVNRLQYQAVISLQNTSVNVEGKQIIYLHQSIPFIDFNIPLTSLWNLKLWLYKRFYSYFIFLFVDKNTSFIVQAKWLKEILSDKYHIDAKKISIIKPKARYVPLATNSIHNVAKLSKQLCNIIYPATPIFYKNHCVIIDALRILKEQRNIDNLCFNVTFSKGEYAKFDDLVRRYNLGKNIRYLGYLTRDELYQHYDNSAFMVYPSYVETCGLPLLEAASKQLPIIASDLPYACEMLEAYTGVVYVKYNVSTEWAREIDAMARTGETRIIPPLLKAENGSDWNKLDNIIEGKDDV